jgi:hypothetical protein
MDFTFTDFMWLKLVVLAVAAGAVGLYAGLTGRSIEEVLRGRRSPKDPE